jgi:phospholipase D1/2
MREHVGIDVDAIVQDELLDRQPLCREDEVQKWDPEHEQAEGERTVSGVTKVKKTLARDRMAQTAQTAMASGGCTLPACRRDFIADFLCHAQSRKE